MSSAAGASVEKVDSSSKGNLVNNFISLVGWISFITFVFNCYFVLGVGAVVDSFCWIIPPEWSCGADKNSDVIIDKEKEVNHDLNFVEVIDIYILWCKW